MLIQEQPPLHLTYCLNIHPGESWPGNFAAIRTHALRVRNQVAGGKPFGLGLRLSALATQELSNPAKLTEFRDFLRSENLYAFTINGFPYGQFHGTAVKENVYAPDWQDPRRRDYTVQLADILAALLPEGVPGSISTVPCSYKPWITSASQVTTMVAALADVAAHLADIRRRTGRDICLALEPEPDCYLETVEECIEFFTRTPWPAAARENVRQHLGVCLDTAHAAVEFENPARDIERLHAAGIRIGKVQLSAALTLPDTPQALQKLADFLDPVYLHQVKASAGDDKPHSFPDLKDALAACGSASGCAAASPCRDLRVHFHVPLFCEHIEPLASTASQLTPDFWQLLRGGLCPHAEIETYTFTVLPPELRTADVTDSIVREYQWVLAKLNETPR